MRALIMTARAKRFINMKKSTLDGEVSTSKFLVVGAGGQGAPCASILSRDPEVSRIVLADINEELLNKVSKKIRSGKLTTVRVDAGILEDLKNAAKGVDAVINLTHIRFNAKVMEAAVKSGAHYVDTALDYEGIWKQLVENKPLNYDKEFRKAGLTAVLGCGGSPGITNVLARYLCDKLDSVDSIRIVLGGKSLRESKDVVETWEPGWSPEIALSDYAHEVDIFRDGEFSKVPPFSGAEEYKFPGPVGPLLVSWHCHEEPVMLPRFIGKGVKYVDFRYPVDKIAGALIKLGFASYEPIEVKGVKVAPVDVLMRLVRRPVNEFLIEDEKKVKASSLYKFYMVIEVEGEKAGEKIQCKIIVGDIEPNADEKLKMFRKFRTTMIWVAAPAIIGAKMSIEGDAEQGVIGSECLNPIKFLKKMAGMGTPVRFEETISKSVSVS